MAKERKISISKESTELVVLSKLLYFLTSTIVNCTEIQLLHKTLLLEELSYEKEKRKGDVSENRNLVYRSIPWDRLLEIIVDNMDFLNKIKHTGVNFSKREILYMCALICGVTGREYEIITGLKSHYNLSYSIRRKLKVPRNSTNLGIYLKRNLVKN